MNVIALDRDPHRAVQALLPWYVRGRLEPEELREVQSHLRACPLCRTEFEAEQRLLELPEPAQALASDVEAGLARLRLRLDDATTLPARAPPSRDRAERYGPRGLAWMLGLQGAAIAGLLLVLVWPRMEPAAYRGLAAGAPATANALVMFSPQTSEEQIRRALRASGATLVGGPTASHAYLLQLPVGAQAQALARLRAQAGVTLAESLQAQDPR